MEDGIRLQVISAYADCVSALERLKVTDSALGQSEEALRIVRERYAEGMAMMVELLGSEESRTSAQGSRVVAARDLALARAALDLASARSLIPGGASAAPAN
jgi:outer membrane protein TolC